MSNIKLINADPKDQKLIESYISAFTIMMAKEQNIGVSLITMTISLVADQAFQDSLISFDEKNPLQQKAKEILMQLRELNKKPINTALTSFLVAKIRLNIAQQNQNKAAEKGDLTKNKMGF